MAENPQVDPQSVMTGQFNVLPQTSPVQPQPTQDPMQQSLLQASQLGQQTFTDQLSRMRAIGDQLAQARGEQASMYRPENLPKTGYQPNFEPVTGGKSLFHDIGKALLYGVGLTGPGQQIQRAIYAPGVRKWQEQTGGKAEQIRELQEQLGTEEKPLEAASQLQYRPYMAAASGTRAQADMLNAQTRAMVEPLRAKISQQRNQIMLDLGNKKITTEQARTQMMKVIGDARNQALQSVAGMYSDQRDRDAQVQAVEREFQQEMDHPIMSLIGAATGMATPPSQSPTPAPGPKAKGTAVNNSPTRPNGVPANAVWNPSTRTWQLPKSGTQAGSR